VANITKIKAKDPTAEKPKQTGKTSAKKSTKSEKPEKKPFLLFRPFVALGRYLKNSWKELRQVHWPTRKATWKMALAIFVYTVLFGGFLVVLDILFDFIFSKLLG